MWCPQQETTIAFLTFASTKVSPHQNQVQLYSIKYFVSYGAPLLQLGPEYPSAICIVFALKHFKNQTFISLKNDLLKVLL